MHACLLGLLGILSLGSVARAAPKAPKAPATTVVRVDGSSVCGGVALPGDQVMVPLSCLPFDVDFQEVRVGGKPVSLITREQGVGLALAKVEPVSKGADKGAVLPLSELYTGSMGDYYGKPVQCEGFAPEPVTLTGVVSIEVQGRVGLQGQDLPAAFCGSCTLETPEGPRHLGMATVRGDQLVVLRTGPLDAWIRAVLDPDGGHGAPAATAPDEGLPLRGYMVEARTWSYLYTRFEGDAVVETQVEERWVRVGTDAAGITRYIVSTTADKGHGPQAQPVEAYFLGPEGLRVGEGDHSLLLLPAMLRPGVTWDLDEDNACTLSSDTRFCPDGLRSTCLAGDPVTVEMQNHYCPGQGWRGQDLFSWQDGVLRSEIHTSRVRRDGRAAFPEVSWDLRKPTLP